MQSIHSKELKKPRLGPVQRRILLHLFRNEGPKTIAELTDANNPPRWCAWNTFRRSVHRSVFALVERDYVTAYRQHGRGGGRGAPWRCRLTPRGVAVASGLKHG